MIFGIPSKVGYGAYRNRIHENDAYETLKEEKKRHGASKTAEELESYIYGLTCAVDIVEKYVDKENVE